MDFEKDYYAILGLESAATADEVKKAYRVLAKRYHPDINRTPSATDIFNAINEAYEVLSDPGLRAEYDAVTGVKPRGSPPKGDAGVGGRRGEGKKKPPVHAPRPTAEVRRERIFQLSLLIPGLFQIDRGERKLGVMFLAAYFTLWALSLLYGLEIGMLAVLAWALALLDAYGSYRKGKVSGDEHRL